MVDRPIMFSAPMIGALLAGRKTQTRRLASSPLRKRETGDRLWVREDWSTPRYLDGVAPRDLEPNSAIWTRADERWSTGSSVDNGAIGRRRASMHMPRWASRITLRLTAVRIEPLQSISEGDAIAEGLYRNPALQAWQAIEQDDWPSFTDPRRSYAGLWQLLHTADGQRWQDNPQVLVLTFDVQRRNIDGER